MIFFLSLFTSGTGSGMILALEASSESIAERSSGRSGCAGWDGKGNQFRKELLRL
jgi:hypothetical protein